jgi:hypothetical protein
MRIASRRSGRLIVLAIALVFAPVGLAGCAALQELAALDQVAFEIQSVSDVRLAGIDLSEPASFADLGLVDAGRLAASVAAGRAPLELTVHVQAENPAANPVTARLIRMDWTLLIDERETLSGVLDRNLSLPPGEPVSIPVGIELDLLEFFDGGARELFDLGLSVTGLSGQPSSISLRATPVIDTPVGAMRYPQPITIVSSDVGGAR